MNMHTPILSFAHAPQPVSGGVASVREEALRALADLSETMPLTTWRGRSGRRYVVSVVPADTSPSMDGGGVLLAVTRAADGRARLLGSIGLAESSGGDAAPVSGTEEALATSRNALASWCDAMRACGACEWHLHLLAKRRLAQEAMRADLACLPRTTS